MATMRQMKMRITTDDNHFPGMKKFKVHGKELQTLPRGLFSLLDLEILDLSPERETCLFFRLSILPKEISQLALLKVLILDTNHIRQLPDEICLLKSLERLTVSNNQIEDVPESFYKLKKLRSLHCANNKFKTIPEGVIKLEELEFLDFSDNNITSLPSNINKMKRLESLILNYNQITMLPDTLCELRDLRMLWLSGNFITKLPLNFGKLTKLDWTWWCTSSALDGNPLTYPPLQVAKLGPYAIEQFFRKNALEKASPRKNHVPAN